MEQKELRYTPLEMRVLTDDNGKDTRTIRGTAIVFNSQSELINEQGITFYETITPEAVTPELIAESDIVMLYNHKKDAGVLARSKRGTGTLKIWITETGVDFEFEAPNSPNGDNILESVKRGDLDACSFAFRTKEGGDVWQKIGSIYHRTIRAIAQLADFSIVVNPAYSATTCNTRGLEELIQSEEEAVKIAEAKAIEAQRLLDVEASIEKEKNLTAYYENLRKIVSTL